MRKAYLGPVSCDPLRWALLLGTGLLVCGALGRAKGVRQLQDAAICQPLFTQDLPPLKSTITALGALQRQRYRGARVCISNMCFSLIAGPGICGGELPRGDPLPAPSHVCPT